MPTPKKRPVAKKATTAKKPAKRTAKPAAKAKAAPVTTASAAAQPPMFKVVASTSRTSSNASQPEWWTNAVKLAQQNPAVTFVAIVAAALGLVLLFS